MSTRPRTDRRRLAVAFVLLGSLATTAVLLYETRRARHSDGMQPVAYSGSGSCRDCHEGFYGLWSTSRHALAMQPFGAALELAPWTPKQPDVVVAGRRYRADLDSGEMVETTSVGAFRHPIAHVMGGKNVYFFLTPAERGRLQVLPAAYDVRRNEWYDVAASGLRHFTDVAEEAVHWTERDFTFNTACYGCHVSQLRNNYDPVSDAYQTTWAEPGINCETCHGPSEEHIRAAKHLAPEQIRSDPKLIALERLSAEQRNDLCASCHARLSPISDGFRPSDRFFDRFDLVGLENRDYFPDGRDLGENYTFTSWRMSPCVRSGRLDCLHCHTSSGRLRWKDPGDANQACLPCHATRVRDVRAHSRHRDTACIDCHMPKTEFARMRRSDHSMRPPSPAATIAFGSPNACNLCHQDRDAGWAGRAIAAWGGTGYQATVVARGALIASARTGDWSRLSQMVAEVQSQTRDEVVAVALLRLLANCPSSEKWPAIEAALKDPSPWVRAAAAESAGQQPSSDVVAALAKLTRDPVRLPRIRAANALTGVAFRELPEGIRADVEAATRELEASLGARPDDFASQYDLGRLYASRGDRNRAITAYETALRLRPDMVAALVNVSLLYNAVGRNGEAEASLRRALRIQPVNAAAHLDLGMLLGELGRFEEAEAALRDCLREDPSSAAAAYNLAVLLFRDRPDEAVRFSERAATLDPSSAKYAYAWAYFVAKRGDRPAAITILRKARDRGTTSGESHALLGKLLGEVSPTVTSAGDRRTPNARGPGRTRAR